jgi:hypothetical protein
MSQGPVAAPASPAPLDPEPLEVPPEPEPLLDVELPPELELPEPPPELEPLLDVELPPELELPEPELELPLEPDAAPELESPPEPEGNPSPDAEGFGVAPGPHAQRVTAAAIMAGRVQGRMRDPVALQWVLRKLTSQVIAGRIVPLFVMSPEFVSHVAPSM